MKRALIGISLAVFLISTIIGLTGCGGYLAELDACIEKVAWDVGRLGPADNPAIEQMGETKEEGHRRHLRNLRLSRQQFMEDWDSVLLLDEPSTLTNKVIP